AHPQISTLSLHDALPIWVRAASAPTFRGKPGLATGFCQFPYAQNVALSLRNGDHAACVKKIENMTRFNGLVVGRQRHQMAFLLRSEEHTSELQSLTNLVC